jgi:hypothetical protein
MDEESTEKKKGPFIGTIVAVILLGLVIALVIGAFVL